MSSYLKAYLASAIIFITLDACWLSVMGPRLYKPLLQGALADTVRPVPALLFYLLYIGGIVVFAVAPSPTPPRLASVILRGIGFGLVAYATYDLTNQATLRTWPPVITLADIGWGMFATAAAATAGSLAAHWQARM
ncbi:MAG TPA: DUF2177 family protein [Acidocella sp.]|nr:DUF2177 family protein [Acidocella sp.]